MRILVISQYFWPEDFRINDLVRGLSERGHKITVLTGLPNYPKGELAPGYRWHGPYVENYEGVKVVRAPLVTRGASKGVRLLLNYVSFAISASLVGLLRCRENYDAIFVYEPSPITVGVPARVMSWFKRTPVFFWVQDLWPESLSATGAVKNKKVLGAVGALVRWVYRGCKVVLAQSEGFRKPLMTMQVPDERIVYFPNSAEAFYKPVPRGTSWSGQELPDGFRVMFAGNMGAAQSLDTIVEAADILRNEKTIKWIIVGDGRQREWVQNEVARRGLQEAVHLMGRHPVHTMPSWFAQADVMLASLSCDPIFAMTIPAKIQSYLACAKPIIAALDGEGARIVEEAGTGVGVPAENARALADAVLAMSRKSPDELRQMGESGLDYFNGEFERELLLNKLEAVFEKHVGKRQ
ncbi:glycosyltransferase family 4 protein [Rhizobium sp. CNPSo 3490]|uniref:glycosyltransferase family 4 protein n=1 Tax=Rhizobium sp. CNPSo 3490 TaxID=3021407 RepID=UPI00254E0C2D|nr:glycosyltransferase family 4 protein [Rhizobium sp. CNPSo 3490]MDK4736445.1 glycosyltransferase family 4 protein [Rhizobium sp. CNPSo 3490]